jgi:hypothetical protein
VVTIPKRGSSWLAGAGLLGMLLAFGAFASRPARTLPVVTAASAGPIFVNAAVLASRFEHSAVEAENLFKGRAITMSGRLESVGDNYVSLRENGGTVRCAMGRRTTAQERGILPGSILTLRGVVAGTNRQGRIDVTACELLPQPD